MFDISDHVKKGAEKNQYKRFPRWTYYEAVLML